MSNAAIIPNGLSRIRYAVLVILAAVMLAGTGLLFSAL